MADDEEWLDALAGARASADEQQRREHEAIRRAARALESQQGDELAERRLLRRLEKEGLLRGQQVSRNQGLRHLARAAVVVLSLGIVLEWFVFREPVPAPVADEGAVERKAQRRAPEAVADAPAPARQSRPPVEPESPRQAALAAKAEREAEAEADEWLRLREEALRDRAGSLRQESGEGARRVTIDVKRRAPVVEELKRLLEDAGLQRVPDPTADADVAEAPNPGEIWLLCHQETSCERINAWLQSYDAARVFEPGRLVRLYLREP